MALTTTTITAAMTVNDVTMRVASTTGFGRNYLIKVGDEEMYQTAEATGLVVPVMRGVNATYNKAHAVTSNVTVGTGADFGGPAPTVVSSYPLSGRARLVLEYGVAGAIALPVPGSDAVAIINGTAALAMTLADPTKDMDSDILTIIANGKAAHTVTYAAGFGNASTNYTIATYPTGGQTAVQLMACNGIWCSLPGPWAGTVTAIDISVS